MVKSYRVNKTDTILGWDGLGEVLESHLEMVTKSRF